MNRIFLQKNMFRSILLDTCHELFCVFRDFASGMQDTEVTKSLGGIKNVGSFLRLINYKFVQKLIRF